jgi:hypothetical protein
MTPLPSPPVTLPSRCESLLFLLAAFLTPLGYAWYTNHVWEDYLITFRHSQNLCEGHGLVYRPGERVHGFTSPLGTLLPALCHAATGQRSYLAALWLFRVLSALAFAGSGLVLFRLLRENGSGRVWCFVFGALYLLEAKAVAFSMNGMETAFMLLFTAWGLLVVVRDPVRCWLGFGLCAAGLMWTRPDGCVFFAVLALAGFLFAEQPRKAVVWAIVKSGLVCTLLYLPWFLWAWSYYGSPIPNTIRAKAAYGSGHSDVADIVFRMARWWPERISEVYRPIYFVSGDWPLIVELIARGLGFVAALYWLCPVRDRLGRVSSFCFFLLCGYLSFLSNAFPWYMPPVAVLGLVAVVRCMMTIADKLAPSWQAAPVVLQAVLLLVCVERAWLLVGIARQMEMQQAEIETGNRMQVGLWLKDHVAAGERVYLEPLGYIGYFSEAKMLDYPGLVSPEVVEACRTKPSDPTSIGLRLAPEWMVLRPQEAVDMAKADPKFSRQYELMKVFDATERLELYPTVPGRGYALFDAVFEVYKRRNDPASAKR